MSVTLPALPSSIDPKVRRAFKLLVDALNSQATTVAATSQTLSFVTEGGVGGGGSSFPVPVPPTGLVATGIYNQILLTWDAFSQSGYAHMQVWRADSDNLGVAVLIGTTSAAMYVDTPPNQSASQTYYYWIRAVNQNDPPDYGPYNATPGTAGSTATDPTWLLETLADELGYEQFDVANGIFPVRVVAVLPTLPDANWPEGSIVYLTTDGKMYRTDGTIWTQKIATVDLDGTVDGDQLTDGAVSLAKFAAGLEAIGVVAALPDPAGYTGPSVVFLTSDSTLYRLDTGVWTNAVNAALVAGQLTDSQLAAIAAAKLTGEIVETQIADDAISTAKIQAGAISANEIAAGTITSENIATGTITAGNILGGTITADELAVNSVTAGAIIAGAIGASELDVDAVTAGKIVAGAILAEHIGTNEIIANSANIADAVITSAKIESLAADKIAAGTVSSLITIVGGVLRSADSLVSLDMASKTLHMENSSSGDYVQMTPGELQFYQNSTLYKFLRRIDNGVASTGSPVTFSPAFNSAPQVIVSPYDMPLYDPDSEQYDQRIVLYADSVQASGFTPMANLVRSGSGAYNENVGNYVAGQVDVYTTEYTTVRTDVTQIKVNMIAYWRTWDSENEHYVYSTIKVDVEYKPVGGSWAYIVNDYTQYEGAPFSVTKTGLTAGQYVVRAKIDLSYGFIVAKNYIEVDSVDLTTSGQPSIGSGDVYWWAIE